MGHVIISSQRRMLRLFWIWLALLLVFGLTGRDYAIAAEYTLKFGHVTAKDAQDEIANLFAKEVEQRSGGRIKVQVYNAGQLGNDVKNEQRCALWCPGRHYPACGVHGDLHSCDGRSAGVRPLF